MKILSIVMCVMGLVSLVNAFRHYTEAKEVEAWPSVTGQMVKAEVAVEKGGKFVVTGSYQYEVEGSSYESDRLVYIEGGYYRTREDAEQAVEEYMNPGQVQVYYSPEQVEEAVLKLPSSEMARTLMMMSGVVILLGGAVYFSKHLQKK